MSRNLMFKIVSFIFLSIFCSVSFGMEAASSDLIEEGWRYGASLKVQVPGVDEPFDIEHIHRPMAYMVDEAQQTIKDTKNKDIKNKKSAGGAVMPPESEGQELKRFYCCFRFTPVINRGCIQLGKTIAITSDMADEKLQIMGTGYEYVFVSGYGDLDTGSKTSAFVSAYSANHMRIPDSVKKDIFFVGYPVTRSNLPYSFLVRNYIDPAILMGNVGFRYGETRPQGPIEAIHTPTLGEISKRNEDIDKALEKARGLVSSTEITTLLNPLKELELKRRGLGNSDATNSYTCAEQVGLDFIADSRIFEALQSRLRIGEDEVVGLLIHCHTTACPCGTCATSLARECEEGGIFNLLSNTKRIRLINTTSNIYDRPAKQIKVKDTTSFKHVIDTPLEGFHSPISFDLSAPSPLPFTTVLYKPLTPGGTDYSPEGNHIKTHQDKAAAERAAGGAPE